MTITTDGGYESASDYDEETLVLIANEEQGAHDDAHDVEYMAPDDADKYASLVAQRVLSVQVTKPEQNQRHNLFHTKGVVKELSVRIIIDGGSDTVRRIVLSLLVGYPKCKVRSSVATSFPLANMLRFRLSPVGLQEIQEGGKVNNGVVHNSRLLTSPGPAHTTSNFAPNEYRGVVNSSGLAVYKGSTQVIIVVVLKVNAKSKLRL